MTTNPGVHDAIDDEEDTQVRRAIHDRIAPEQARWTVVSLQGMNDNIAWRARLGRAGHSPRIFKVFVAYTDRDAFRLRQQRREEGKAWFAADEAKRLYDTHKRLAARFPRKDGKPFDEIDPGPPPPISAMPDGVGELMPITDGFCQADCRACARERMEIEDQPLDVIGIFDTSAEEIAELKKRIEELEARAHITAHHMPMRRW